MLYTEETGRLLLYTLHRGDRQIFFTSYIEETGRLLFYMLH